MAQVHRPCQPDRELYVYARLRNSVSQQRGPETDGRLPGLALRDPRTNSPDWRHTSRAVLRGVPLTEGDHEIVLLMQGSYNLGALHVGARGEPRHPPANRNRYGKSSVDSPGSYLECRCALRGTARAAYINRSRRRIRRRSRWVCTRVPPRDARGPNAEDIRFVIAIERPPVLFVARDIDQQVLLRVVQFTMMEPFDRVVGIHSQVVGITPL